VIPTSFDYQRATSIDDALQKLAGGGKLLAGGHSLIPLMKLRLSEPGVLIDIARIPELSGIREKNGQIEIGAATVHHDVATSRLILERCPALAETAAEIGDPQVRNRGTLGGSIAHADPSADYPAVMLALDAEIDIRGPKGARIVAARDFFKELFTVDLAADEIIISVRFAPTRSAAYVKLHQRASHFAIVGVAAALEVSNGTIRAARIGLTGAGPVPTRLTAVEQALAGKAASNESIAAAAANAGAGITELNSDIHASEEYRRAMIAVFTRRALEGALGRT
jgi:aerobic carbon-monoxide dehydrogenase medium subunit